LWLFFGWVIKKVLDFMVEKLGVHIRAKRPLLQLHSLSNLISNIICEALRIRYVSNLIEFKKLARDLKNAQVRKDWILVVEGRGKRSAFRWSGRMRLCGVLSSDYLKDFLTSHVCSRARV